MRVTVGMVGGALEREPKGRRNKPTDGLEKSVPWKRTHKERERGD